MVTTSDLSRRAIRRSLHGQMLVAQEYVWAASIQSCKRCVEWVMAWRRLVVTKCALSPANPTAGRFEPMGYPCFDHGTKKTNYTSIDPKQQQRMFPPRSCAIQNSWKLSATLLLRKERREKKGDKHRNPSPKQEEPGNP